MRHALFIGIFFLTLISVFVFIVPNARASTATAFEISGWIPYWREATGTVDTLSHMQDFTAVMPFGYIVQNDGSLYDAFGLDATSSTSNAHMLTAVAKAEKVKIIPTVMWSNGAVIDRVLRVASTRQALETAIAALAKKNNFGNQRAEPITYPNLFSQGLITFSE